MTTLVVHANQRYEGGFIFATMSAFKEWPVQVSLDSGKTWAPYTQSELSELAVHEYMRLKGTGIGAVSVKEALEYFEDRYLQDRPTNPDAADMPIGMVDKIHVVTQSEIVDALQRGTCVTNHGLINTVGNYGLYVAVSAHLRGNSEDTARDLLAASTACLSAAAKQIKNEDWGDANKAEHEFKKLGSPVIGASAGVLYGIYLERMLGQDEMTPQACRSVGILLWGMYVVTLTGQAPSYDQLAAYLESLDDQQAVHKTA